MMAPSLAERGCVIGAFTLQLAWMTLERYQHRERTEVYGIYAFNPGPLPLCLPLNPTQTLCPFFSAAFWAAQDALW